MNALSEQDQPINAIIEPINRYFHNPIAARIVKALIGTWVTPDQVTYISIFIGLVAAYIYSFGTVQSFFLAGILLEMVMILDCVDGQLARATKCASDFGRLLDGIAGYIIYLAVLVGIMIGLGNHYGALATIGMFIILRAISYDYCKLAIITMIQKGYDGNQKEILDTYLKLSNNASIIFKFYFYYLQLQQFIFCGRFVSLDQFNENDDLIYKDKVLTSEERENYRKKIFPLMVIWSWNGVDFPIFLLAIVSVVGVMEFFLRPLAYLLALQFVITMVYHRIQNASFLIG